MAWVGGNFYLNDEQQKMNAEYLWGFFSARGWTLNAVSGMLGNMETESTINPGIWQSLDPSHPQPWGFGIVQWTPSTKYTDWCTANGLLYTEMDSNLLRIVYEVENNIQWIQTLDYPLTFEDFTVSEEPPYYLAMAFLRNYERPADMNQPWRGTQANKWYEYLSGIIPPEPPTNKRKMPIYFYLRKEIPHGIK